MADALLNLVPDAPPPTTQLYQKLDDTSLARI